MYRETTGEKQMGHYIKLIKGTTEHKYMVEYYDVDGNKTTDATEAHLMDLDKRCSGKKLRMNGWIWGTIAADGSINPVAKPKFMRS
jgi:hypothetical protein